MHKFQPRALLQIRLERLAGLCTRGCPIRRPIRRRGGRRRFKWIIGINGGWFPGNQRRQQEDHRQRQQQRQNKRGPQPGAGEVAGMHRRRRSAGRLQLR